jgi:cellulose synthase/poly-beta-1,6-N-acetylglucosamine synthase-like glycosyltransferase
MSRLGWSFLNMTPIISGALGLYRVDVLRAVGGFRNVFAEDMDMTFRVHRYIRDRKAGGRIGFAPDAKAWTEVPPDLRSVGSQRSRWHNSVCDTLWTFRSMLFRPRYGRVGFILLPWFWIYELGSPFIELLGWTYILISAVLGLLNWPLALTLLGAGYVFAVNLSVLSLQRSETAYPRYSLADRKRLLLQSLCEVFPLRFLYIYWQLRGQVQYFRGDQRWQRVTRVGFDQTDYQKKGI